MPSAPSNRPSAATTWWSAPPAAWTSQALIHDKTAALQRRSPEVVAALAAFYDSLNPAQQQMDVMLPEMDGFALCRCIGPGARW